jgi:hypothetical protein
VWTHLNIGVTTAVMTASGAPMTKRRSLLVASNGTAEAITLSTRFRISATGSASSSARAVGTTPLGVLRNRGSFNKPRSRPSA